MSATRGQVVKVNGTPHLLLDHGPGMGQWWAHRSGGEWSDKGAVVLVKFFSKRDRWEEVEQ